MRRSTFLTILMAGLLVVGLAAANVGRDPGVVHVDWRIVRAPKVEVRVSAATRASVAQTITAPGTVEAIEQAKVGSQMVGRVIAVNVKEGSRVKTGDVLVKLDDSDSRSRSSAAKARIDRIRASIAQAASELEKAVRDEAQLAKLANRGHTTTSDLANARTLVAKAEAALEMSRQELSDSQAMWQICLEELNRTQIRSPIDGVVTDLNVGVGEVVIAGTVNLPGTVLMTVSDLNHMRACAEVDESDVPSIHPGQPSRVYLQADERNPVMGEVEKVATKGRKVGEAVSFETRVRIDGPRPALRVGMTATIEIEVDRHADALCVPVHAVVHRKRKDLPDTPEVRAWAERNARSPGEKARDAETRYIKVVFTIDGGIARARPVETGVSDERRVEILNGLATDERVIVGPFRALDELRDGQPVLDLSDEGARP